MKDLPRQPLWYIVSFPEVSRSPRSVALNHNFKNFKNQKLKKLIKIQEDFTTNEAFCVVLYIILNAFRFVNFKFKCFSKYPGKDVAVMDEITQSRMQNKMCY